MPFAALPQAEPATGRDKRRIVVVVTVLAVLLAGAGIWAAIRPGAYGSSATAASR